MVKKYSVKLLIIVVSICTLLVLIISSTYAKYVFDKNTNNSIIPDDFIFVSNYINNESYDIYRNYIDIEVSNKDILGINETNILFDIKVEKKSDSTIIYNYKNQLLTGGVESNKTFNFTDLAINTTYVVTISSTSPVSKTIKHEFKVLDDELIESFYTIIDKGDWIELDIYIGTNPISKLDVKYSSSLVADNTNDLCADWFTTEGSLLNLKVNSHYQLIFFKVDNTSYTNINNGEIIHNTITIE